VFWPFSRLSWGLTVLLPLRGSVKKRLSLKIKLPAAAIRNQANYHAYTKHASAAESARNDRRVGSIDVERASLRRG
jgi:hypothetical protein